MKLKKILFGLAMVIHLSSLCHSNEEKPFPVIKKEDLLKEEIYALCIQLKNEYNTIQFHEGVSFKDITTPHPTPPLTTESSTLETIKTAHVNAVNMHNNRTSMDEKTVAELETIKGELLHVLSTIQLLKTEYYFKKSNLPVIYKEDLRRFISSIIKVLITKTIFTLTKDSLFEPLVYWVKTYYAWSMIVTGWRVVGEMSDALAYYALTKHPFPILS